MLGMILVAAAAAALVLTGCEQSQQPAGGAELEILSEEAAPGHAAAAAESQPAQEAAQEPTSEEDTPQAADEAEEATMVTIETSKGTIKAKLYDQKAPVTAGNFILLAEEGFYDGLTFHRVEPGFVIQGGDPNGDGTGGPGFSIPLETSPELRHKRGTLSMARSMDPDSAGSQFFICLARETAKHLDDEYAAFGKVIEGMQVVDQIEVGDQIEKVTVTSESAHAETAREAAREARVPDEE
ncbi:MAG: peptidylprolyl isomerase [Armatimonadota bacterium]